jgi:hypothetical protein
MIKPYYVSLKRSGFFSFAEEGCECLPVSDEDEEEEYIVRIGDKEIP